jgi:hypothetical protein
LDIIKIIRQTFYNIKRLAFHFGTISMKVLYLEIAASYIK